MERLTGMSLKITPELVNRWRIVPRIIVILYGYTFYEVAHWFMALPEPNAAQSTFVSVIVGAAAAFFGLYVNSGASLSELKENRNE